MCLKADRFNELPTSDSCDEAGCSYPGYSEENKPSANCYRQFRLRVTAVEEMVNEV